MAGPRQVALVVGLNRYRSEAGLHDLRFAAADAEAVGRRLESAGYEVTRLVDVATREAFEAAFAGATADLQRDDLFLLYFAGHAQLEPGGAERELSLLFSDDAGVDGDGLRVEELADRVAAVGARHRVVLLDTCYSERTQQILASSRGAPVLAAPSVGRFDAWIFSAAPQQSAQEDEALGHGVFTWFLLQALDGRADADGDGAVGVLEVYNWVGFHTAERTGRAQVPWIEESRVGWSDLPLVRVEATSPSAAIPWYERVLPGATVLLDGLSRGPGPVEAGRHDLEVRDREGRVVVQRRVDARPGEVLDWSDWVASSGSSVRLGVGLGWVGAPALTPPVAGGVSGWWRPRAPGVVRAALGGQLIAARGALAGEGAADVDVVSGTVRASGLWMARPQLALGPFVGAGAAWRREPEVLGTTPLFEGGVVLQAEMGPVWIGVDGGLGAWTIEGSWAAHPRGAVVVGAVLR